MENTEDKIQNLRDGRVATMTTDTDASLSVPKNETKEDTKPNANLLKRIDELTRERVNAFETQQRKLEEEERRQLEKELENARDRIKYNLGAEVKSKTVDDLVKRANGQPTDGRDRMGRYVEGHNKKGSRM